MPLFPTVAGRATRSGTGCAAADSSRVFKPGLVGAGAPFAQLKAKVKSLGAIGADGVSASTKLWLAPAAMSTVALGLPVTRLVAGSVVWNANCAGTVVTGATRHPTASPPPVLIMVAKAVAVAPTCTERLAGRTAARRLTEVEGTSRTRTQSPFPGPSALSPGVVKSRRPALTSGPLAMSANVPAAGSYHRAVAGPLSLLMSTVTVPGVGTYAITNRPSGVRAAVT